MTTSYYTATSVDGYIADADNSLDWLFALDEAGGSEPEAAGMQEEYPRFLADVGAMAMGATTYEWIAAHTGFVEDPAKWEYTLPTWVFTHRKLPRPDGIDVRFVSGDVAPVHDKMLAAAAGKNVWLVGGGDLVGQFHDAGRLDEIILGVASVTLGSGAPLLPRRITSPPLRLLEVTRYGSVFATLRYAVPRPS